MRAAVESWSKYKTPNIKITHLNEIIKEESESNEIKYLTNQRKNCELFPNSGLHSNYLLKFVKNPGQVGNTGLGRFFRSSKT